MNGINKRLLLDKTFSMFTCLFVVLNSFFLIKEAGSLPGSKPNKEAIVSADKHEGPTISHLPTCLVFVSFNSNLFFRYHVYFLRLQCMMKQLSDSVFVICKIINVS